MKMNNNNLWVIGSGYMAKSYAEVLLAQKIKFKIIGKSRNRLYEPFFISSGCILELEGINKAIDSSGAPKEAIIAVNSINHIDVLETLIKSGTKKILIEKPGSLSSKELERLNFLAKRKNCKIYVGYNRRFYASVLHLRKLIEKEGGILSVNFEFTEWSHLIENEKIDIREKNKWLICNSSHVIDLVFFFIGIPKLQNSYFLKRGNLNWHPSSSIFIGCGISKNNIPFSYNANWEAPGRWCVELMTKKNKYILKPLEELKKVPLGETNEVSIDIENIFDLKFKPGIYLQTKSFTENNFNNLCTIEQQVECLRIYEQMAGY